MWVRHINTGATNSKSFLLSPKTNIEIATKQSILNSSSMDTSFDINGFSFNGEDPSGYYAYTVPDG